jgi:hypothetical protein
MTYNPMDFVLEGQGAGSTTWTPLLSVTDFDFSEGKQEETPFGGFLGAI